MFFRFIIRALQYRKQRLMLAFFALAVAATLATVLFGIYGGIERRIRDEFRSYGANIVAMPVGQSLVPALIAKRATDAGAEASTVLVDREKIGDAELTVVGYQGSENLTPYWKVTEGVRATGPGECIAGENVASREGLRVGQRVALPIPCTLKGIISTGGAEDDELITAGSPTENVSFVLIRAQGERVEQMRSTLAAEFPQVDVRVVRSVADTESNVVLKLRAALFLLTMVILGITTLCVTSNFSEMVIERSKEIGILKALGAAERRIAGFFLSESAALALGATVLGYIAGLFAAAAIAQGIFGGNFHLQADWLVFVSVTAVMLAIAAVATGISASRIWGIQPAIILRGE